MDQSQQTTHQDWLQRHQRSLAQALDVTCDDLACNQEGRLSERQYKQLVRKLGFWERFFFQRGRFRILQQRKVVVYEGCVSLISEDSYTPASAYSNESAGPDPYADRWRREHYLFLGSRQEWSSGEAGQIPEWWLEKAKRLFEVSPDVFQQMREDLRYRVYFLPKYPLPPIRFLLQECRVVSIEALESPAKIPDTQRVLRKLQQALNFTQEDLQAHRQGLLSLTQPPQYAGETFLEKCRESFLDRPRDWRNICCYTGLSLIVLCPALFYSITWLIWIASIYLFFQFIRVILLIIEQPKELLTCVIRLEGRIKIKPYGYLVLESVDEFGYLTFIDLPVSEQVFNILKRAKDLSYYRVYMFQTRVLSMEPVDIPPE